MRESSRRVAVFGTGDAATPRARLLMDAAGAAGFEVVECRHDVWGGLRDKALARSRVVLRCVGAAIIAYPALVWRYVRLPRHDAVLVLHPGWSDVLVLWPFAHLRRVPIVADMFLPLYETIVEDRRLLRVGSLRARLLAAYEWLVCHAVDHLVLDSKAHASYLQERCGLPLSRVARVFVGAEDKWFKPQRARARPPGRFVVLFYGQFVPLQGVDVIVESARLLAEAGEDIEFVVAGTGQDAMRIDARLRELALANVRRVAWIPYEELASWIAQADVCLGVFGMSGKAARVIPNKVFQALACRRPIITRDGPAIRELVGPSDAVRLIPPGDPNALASAVLDLRRAPEDAIRRDTDRFPEVGLACVASQLRDVMSEPSPARFSFFGPAFPELGWVPSPRYLMRRHLVLSQLAGRPPGHVLEIGPGIGALLGELAGAGWQCTGVETSPRAFGLATEAVGHLKNVAIAPRLGPELGMFDCLLAFEVLEHIEDDASALREWLAHVRSGGAVLLSVPAHQHRWGASDVLVGHWRRYSREQFIQLAEACECKVESVACYGWPLSNAFNRMRAIVDNRRLKHLGTSELTPKQRIAFTSTSGIDRRTLSRYYRFYSNMVGAVSLLVFFWVQYLTIDTELGNGYLLVATKR
jgi:glycosyltransferase involved in cell wall biosynthesis